MDVKVSEEVSNPAGITSAMRNKKATRKSGFCCKSDYGSLLTNSRSYNKKCRTKYGFLVAHCRGFQGKDAVKRSGCVNPAIGNVCALSAEDPKGKALSGADRGLRSSQSRSNLFLVLKYVIVKYNRHLITRIF